MGEGRESLKPIEGANRSLRRRLRLRDELTLALLPTLTVLAMLALVELLGGQRLLFASLASSAFLIYVDPQHGMNTVRTLLIAHAIAVGSGLISETVLGAGYAAAGVAMAVTVLVMVLADAVHPPAVSTSLSFAFRAPTEGSVVLFALALAVVVGVVALQRALLWLLARLSRE